MVGNTFRMPLYYFLSGLFFKPYNGFFNFAIRKANKLLIPFFFFYFCTGVIQIFIDTSMTVLPFFAIGYIFRKYTHILEPNKWDKYWILFVLMSGGITYLLSGGNLMYIENKFDVHPIAFYVSGITGTLCVLFISKAIQLCYWLPIFCY